MFDLDQQIDRWKSAFAKKAACSSDELLELESHLRDQIAALVAAGRSEKEAFCESVARLGDPTKISGESAKNESRFVWDGVALQGNCVVVNLAGLAAIVLGFAVGMKRGDGLLGVHLGTISFAYLVPFLLAVVGTYAIFRAAIVKSDQTQFRDRFAGHCRFLLGVVALVSATGVILGGVWAERHLGRFWGWDPKEIGGLSVVLAALVLCLAPHQTQTRQRPARASELDDEPGDVCRLVWAGGVQEIGRPVRSRRSCRLPRYSAGDSEHLPLSVQTHLEFNPITKAQRRIRIVGISICQHSISFLHWSFFHMVIGVLRPDSVRFHVDRPSLDSVLLNLTGRRLRD